MDLEYTYPIQWFDDMGALALPFANSPRMAVDLSMSGLSRDQMMNLGQSIYATGVSNYPQ